MTDTPQDLQTQKPCANGCVRKGTEDTDHPSPLRAKHGSYCDRCYYQTDRHLRSSGITVEHILTMVAGFQSKNPDGSQRLKAEPPLPFNVDAFNDANEMYSRLVYWCSVWATRLNRQAPVPAARAWRTDSNRIVGLPADVTPTAARYAVTIMALWLDAHLDDIYATGWADDIDYFRTEIADVYRLTAKYPMEDRPQYVPVKCWVQTAQPDGSTAECSAKIIIHPPEYFGDDEKITCDHGHVYDLDEYDRLSSAFRQARKDQAVEAVKAKRVADRLTRKYAS